MSFRLPAGQHFGAIAKRYDVAGFTLTETAYAPNLHLPKHAHERAFFCLVLRGSYLESFRSAALDCKPGSLIFRPAGEWHTDSFHQTESLCFLIELESIWLAGLRDQAAILENPILSQGTAAAWLASKAYEEFRRRDAVSALAIQGLTLTIAAELARQPAQVRTNEAPRWLQQVKELLHAHFSESLTHEQIAKTVGVHPIYLATAFRRHYRCTIGDYVRQLRIEFACREMLHSDESLINIAYAAGFSSQSHFSRTFKQFTGFTPAQYRALRRQA